MGAAAATAAVFEEEFEEKEFEEEEFEELGDKKGSGSGVGEEGPGPPQLLLPGDVAIRRKQRNKNVSVESIQTCPNKQEKKNCLNNMSRVDRSFDRPIPRSAVKGTRHVFFIRIQVKVKYLRGAFRRSRSIK